MSFMLRDGWYCQFLEEDLKTPLTRKLTFASERKIVELAGRAGAAMNLEARQALDHALSIGRGRIWLELSDEQYKRVR